MDNRWLVYRYQFMLLFLKILVQLFPYKTGNVLAARLVSHLYPFRRIKKQNNWPILKQLLKSSEQANKAWAAYAQNIGVSQHQVYYYVQPDTSWQAQCKLLITGREHLDQAMLQGQGVLVMTYHHHYNMLFCILMARLGYPLTTIAMDPKESPLYQDFSQLADKMYQNAALHFNSGGFAMVRPGGYIRPILHAFEQQHMVITANDFPDPFSVNKQMKLDFMAATLTCPTGTVELAIKKKIAVVAAYLRWQSGSHFELVIEPITTVLSATHRDINSEQIMKQYLVVLEKMVKKSPGLWEGWEWLKVKGAQS